MAQRTQPSRAFRVRDGHRRALTWHFVFLSAGLLLVFGLNRALTPEVFWAQWVALAWAVAFVVHLGAFARGTLESMGAWRRKGARASQAEDPATEDAREDRVSAPVGEKAPQRYTRHAAE
jgi:hypothetical protein